MDYSFKILSTDSSSKTMIIRFSSDGLDTIDLNLTIPAEGANLDDYIKTFAPIYRWEAAAAPLAQVVEGYESAATYVAPPPVEAPPINQQPNTVGSFNEEYLRALIYQVLEEIKDATV